MDDMVEEGAVNPTPREVVLTAGAWLAGQFREDGFEWLASRDRADLVPAFANRYLERHPGWRAGLARGAALADAGRRLGPASDWPDELGWLAAQFTARRDQTPRS